MNTAVTVPKLFDNVAVRMSMDVNREPERDLFRVRPTDAMSSGSDANKFAGITTGDSQA